ncbi:MAG: putative replicase [Cressdnaviricota sp.]|nr:MAG: putative replicase [Cressdnaviricota sp.]
MTTSVKFAITLTVKPVHYVKDLNTQAIDLVNEIDKVFESFYKTYVLEVTESGNVHAHGIFQYKRMMPYLISDNHLVQLTKRCSKIIGHCLVKPLIDHDGWLKYIIKDIPVTYQLLKERIHPCQRDHFNYIHPKQTMEDLDDELARGFTVSPERKIRIRDKDKAEPVNLV